MLGTSGYPLVKLLLPLWLDAARPYMDMLHSFVTAGTIQDQYEEFSVIRSEVNRDSSEGKVKGEGIFIPVPGGRGGRFRHGAQVRINLHYSFSLALVGVPAWT